MAAFFLSMGQRALSTPGPGAAPPGQRGVGPGHLRDGSEQELGRADLLAPLERALRYFVWATGAVAWPWWRPMTAPDPVAVTRPGPLRRRCAPAR